MILSASRRTDIPTFYGEWFLNRLRDGFVYVRNPFNYHQVSKIILSPSNVDCIVLWTKDARAFMKYLDEIDSLGYGYYFQYTITPYNNDIEMGIGQKTSILANFIELSKRLGSNRVLWRYDPIFFTDEIDLSYHVTKFKDMVSILKGYTDSVTISFLDNYSKTGKRTDLLKTLTQEQMLEVGSAFANIANAVGLKIKTCAEEIAFTNGIEKASCIDKSLIEKIIEIPMDVKKDKNQRRECLCIESVDIGEYDTCKHFCTYCYANGSKKKINYKCLKHISTSPLLIGEIEKEDVIKEKHLPSLKRLQQTFLD